MNIKVDREPHKMNGSGIFDRIWSFGCPGMNPLSGDGPGGHGSPPLSPSIPQLWIGQAYQPAQARPIAWEPQTPACHQIKWISNSVKAPRLGRAGWRAGRLSPLLHLSWLFCLLFGASLSISNCVSLHLSRPTSLSPPLIVRLDPLKMELGWLWGSRYQWSVLASPLCRDCFNSGRIFN